MRDEGGVVSKEGDLIRGLSSASGTLLSNGLEVLTSVRILFRLEAPSYKNCKVCWTTRCMVFPMSMFLERTKRGLGAWTFDTLLRAGGILVAQFQTTFIDSISKFNAWVSKTPVPPSPDLAILHCRVQLPMIDAGGHFPLFLRNWPREQSSPDVAFGVGQAYVQDQSGSKSLFVAPTTKHETVLPPEYPSVCAFDGNQIFDLPGEDLKGLPKEDLKGLPIDCLDVFPSIFQIRMKGETYPGMSGGPVFGPWYHGQEQIQAGMVSVRICILCATPSYAMIGIKILQSCT